MNHVKKILSAIILTSALSSTAFAAIPGAYVGGGLGYSKLDDFTDLTGAQAGLGGKLFAGYNFNKYFGLEGGYSQFAKTTYDFPYSFIYNNRIYMGNDQIDYKVNAATLAVKGYLPINDQVDLYGLVGIASVQAKASSKRFDYKSDTSSELSALAGAGINFNINSKVSANLEYVRTQGHNGSNTSIGIPYTNLVTVGLAYHFN